MLQKHKITNTEVTKVLITLPISNLDWQLYKIVQNMHLLRNFDLGEQTIKIINSIWIRGRKYFPWAKTG